MAPLNVKKHSKMFSWLSQFSPLFQMLLWFVSLCQVSWHLRKNSLI